MPPFLKCAQYKKTTSIYYYKEKGKKGIKKRAIPIITVYYLGHKLENFDIPVIKVKRKYTNGISEEELKGKEPFIINKRIKLSGKIQTDNKTLTFGFCKS